MNAVSPSPIEIDPRPCELCGLTIDRHQMVDEGEGPEFFCLDLPLEELTLDELERRHELRRQEEIAAIVRDWEMADPRDRWRHTGERPPSTRRESLPPTQAIIDKFWQVQRLQSPDYLAEWLAEHPADAPALYEIWKASRC